MTDLDKARAAPAGWPWRVSKAGNIVTVRGDVVLRGQGENRRERRKAAQELLRRVQASVEFAAERQREADYWGMAAAPPEPGWLWGIEVPDIGRVTAAEIAAAWNASEHGQHATAVVVGCNVEIRPCVFGARMDVALVDDLA